MKSALLYFSYVHYYNKPPQNALWFLFNFFWVAQNSFAKCKIAFFLQFTHQYYYFCQFLLFPSSVYIEFCGYFLCLCVFCCRLVHWLGILHNTQNVHQTKMYALQNVFAFIVCFDLFRMCPSVRASKHGYVNATHKKTCYSLLFPRAHSA